MNKVYCPLVNFHFVWNFNEGFNDLIITDKIKIIPQKEIPDQSILNEHLSPFDYKLYQIHAHYWLVLDGYDEIKYIKEVVNLFQLSLWVIKPTSLIIGFVTNFKNDITQNPFKKLSPFSNIQNHLNCEYTLKDIEKLKIIFPNMIDLYRNKRCKNSLVFNYHGCIASYWEAAYVLFSTTFESLLSHKTHISKLEEKRLNWGLIKKLSWAYAILSENDNSKRQSAYEGFRYIYEIRSYLVHGKTIKDKYNDGDINLKESAKCRDMLRKLWQVILDSEEKIENLSGDDIVRRDYFKKVANGWMPEDKYEKKE